MADRDRSSEPDVDRLPPQDLDAEQATLGAMLLGGEATSRVAEFLRPDDFYRDAHRFICEACFRLFEAREPVDLVTVAAALRSGDKLETIGGFEYLERLVRATPYSTNVEQYARVVREKGMLRQLLFCSQTIARSCYDPESTAAEALDGAGASIMQLAQRHAPTGFKAVRDVSLEVYTQAEDNWRRGSDITGISTGYAKLDNMLSGLQAGDLVIVAARPSMGKTSLAVCMGMNAALAREPAKVGLFSLEMSTNQLVSGMICTHAKVDLSKWRSGQLETTDWDRIAHAMNELNSAPIFIDDSSSLSPLEMRARARRLQSEQGLDLLIVDYLQLMRGNTRTDNRVNEIGEISRSLKGLAKELGVPVLALAQLSRAVEQRPNKRPLLSDLRESGQIEADADVVMFLYRESYYKQKEAEKQAAHGGGWGAEPEEDDPSLPDRTEVIIAKQRNGPTGHVDLGFFRHHKRFVTWDDHQYG